MDNSKSTFTISSIFIALVIFLVVTPVLALAAEKQVEAGKNDVAEIMVKATEKSRLLHGRAVKAEMTMTIKSRSGRTSSKRLDVYSNIPVEGKAKTLLRFLSPPDVKGMGLLILHEKGKDSEQFLYIPALRRTTPIAPTKRGDSFAGSEFSFGDLSAGEAKKARHTLLREEKFQNEDCYVIQSEFDKSHIYSKTISWIRKKDYMIRLVKFFSSRGEPIKEAYFSVIVKISDVDVPTRVKMVNLKTKAETVMEFSNIIDNIDIPEETFTRRFLERGL